MISIYDLKKMLLFIFALLILPYGKLAIPNGLMILINIGLVFIEGGLSFIEHIVTAVCIIAVYLIYSKTNYYMIIGFILTYIWLIYKIDYKEITNSIPVSVSVLIYLLVTSYTSYRIIIDSRLDKNSN